MSENDDQENYEDDSATEELSSEPTDDSALEENIQRRENEINDLIHEEEGAVFDEENPEPELDQSRQPKKGDIVKFVRNDQWVIAKIIHRPKTTFNYNVELLDGEQICVSLKPQTTEQLYAWSLLPQDAWTPEELRSPGQIPSLDPSFEYIEHEGEEEINNANLQFQPKSLQLSISADDTIEHGNVYHIPHTEVEESLENSQSDEERIIVQLPNQIGIFSISPQKYEETYEKVRRTLNLPEDQVTPGLMTFFIYDQLYIEYKKSQSTSSKIIKFFKKKLGKTSK